MRHLSILAVGLLLYASDVLGVSWEEWWTYDGISGPAFWGLINPDWSLCNRGRRQSPVNIEPEKLLYDPTLRDVEMDSHRVNGKLVNTGHSAVFTVSNATRRAVNVTGGPLSYLYQLYELHIHYGTQDHLGSEHTINGKAFPAELQLFGFNSQLYANFSEAMQKPHGIMAIAIMLQISELKSAPYVRNRPCRPHGGQYNEADFCYVDQCNVGDLSNAELRLLTDQIDKIRYGSSSALVNRIAFRGLMPNTKSYMTYDGSATMPGCQETVSWIILNKPIYITKQQLHGLRKLMQGDLAHPKAPLGNNYRSTQPLYSRTIRTNIEPTQDGKVCQPKKYFHYEVGGGVKLKEPQDRGTVSQLR